MNVDDKFELITRNTIEIVGEEELNKLLNSKKKPVIYCGYETSGDIHLGHLVSMTKLLDLQKAGFKVKVLFASRHPMTAEQAADCRRIWGGDVEVAAEAIVFTDVESVRQATEGVDALIAVLPQGLALQVGWLNGQHAASGSAVLAWTDKIVTAVSVPAPAAHGTERVFRHAGFVRPDGRVL